MPTVLLAPDFDLRVNNESPVGNSRFCNNGPSWQEIRREKNEGFLLAATGTLLNLAVRLMKVELSLLGDPQPLPGIGLGDSRSLSTISALHSTTNRQRLTTITSIKHEAASPIMSSLTNVTSLAKLALEDGTVFEGESFGAEGTTTGEVVFNTSMTGYQEIVTDPSYCGQIITMTYPEIGNYGFNDEDLERDRPFLAGFIVRNASPIASNFRAKGTLQEFLQRHQIVGISGIDTRALVRRIRDKGAMRGVISTEILDDTKLIHLAKSSPEMTGRDLVKEVIPSHSRKWTEPLSPWWHAAGHSPTIDQTVRPHLVAMDFGMKSNIGRHLIDQGFRVTVVPGTATAAEILQHQPDGLFLSNGPGDPEPLDYAIATIRELLGQLPIFGICLGHQLLGLACGAKTFKMKFGHRGANQPVIDLETNKIEISTQNHGFAVSEDDLPLELEVTHRNLNDNTIAGLKHKHVPAFSVQYHPEASAGPHDSQYLFSRFREMVLECLKTAP